MTPKEKAIELVEKMSYNGYDEDHNCSHYVAKNCALIAVEEVINNCTDIDIWEYWQNVKQEINLL